ncbi:PREDICTED: uncharacterized protein LOC107165773 [Diuraphis noxia]|uniref:uncharacterized protein LOC107165773 n=1 Tax=Diuraphis noxia TaxID=143948 RepID=UPI000763ABDF|nr:PREDICTED: uncharacterized protein LOC107165773 [Diuraphis noxia]
MGLLHNSQVSAKAFEKVQIILVSKVVQDFQSCSLCSQKNFKNHQLIKQLFRHLSYKDSTTASHRQTQLHGYVEGILRHRHYTDSNRISSTVLKNKPVTTIRSASRNKLKSSHVSLHRRDYNCKIKRKKRFD